MLAFPTNEFGNQEPDEPNEIKIYLMKSFNITFPIFSKVYQLLYQNLNVANKVINILMFVNID